MKLSDLKKSGKISDTKFLKFKSDVVSFLSALCAHLVEESPIKYSLTRNARCFIPSLLVEAPETSEKRFNDLLEAIFTLQQMPGKMFEQAKGEFITFLQDAVTTHEEKFWGFDRALKDHRLDAFYFKYLERKSSFSDFAEALKMILSLFHGQASTEREQALTR